MLTKKHFEDLAEIIRVAKRWEELGKPYDTAEWTSEIISFCRSMNPRFDADKFKRACIPSYYVCLHCEEKFLSPKQLRDHIDTFKQES